MTGMGRPKTNKGNWWPLGLGLAIVFFVSVSHCTKARSHSWYPNDCCSGADCAPIEGERVQENGKEFIVNVPQGWPGQPVNEKVKTIRVPFSDVRWIAPDGGYHACPITYANFVPKFRCFFAPPRQT